MAFQPDQPFPKQQGDTVRSKDWNDVINEVKRQDAEHANTQEVTQLAERVEVQDETHVKKTGDSMSGPLRIDNNLGISTDSGVFRIHVLGTGAGDDGRVMIQTTGGSFGPQLRLKHDAAGGKEWLLISNGSVNGVSGPVGSFGIFSETQQASRLVIDDNGNTGLGTPLPNHPLEMASGAHVTAGGVWTNASSKELKENIRELSESEAVSALDELNPVRFNYKADKEEEHTGFIAEEVPSLVATKDRKSLSPMDIVGVLTKVVQQQQKRMAELEARLESQPKMA